MKIAGLIDHTALKPDTTRDQIRKLCKEALEYGFASVCINPCYVKLCSELLKNSLVKVCTVIGFPLGATTTAAKAAEAAEAVQNGASEIDMVINIGAVKSEDFDFVKSDIEGVVKAVKGKALVKVILETCLLTEEEKRICCNICRDAGADFVKTSTGFSTGGATIEDIRLMRSIVKPRLGVKASGGIRDYKTAKAMVDAGASRIGASASIAIASEENG
ncbi:deoxyribose-phosphate aldolase [Ruminiclostridium sufflavum DSM 19573]|uniref:Deoxyribose-phosphate aldolase n=1 Tax=Ruminiclostridium sufflavum DSM 19573 TaxID=1121337 RepID=A0A318XJL6_9FIRM|nr:deoxyribose-phosphate aldolase [Ruminiclostridium sufflavum]PYG85029.1 deoxyribose-phosphate aldolase [Ruminiclostridium sufflavum DSM 19573]